MERGNVYHVHMQGGTFVAGDQVGEKSEVTFESEMMGRGCGVEKADVGQTESDRVARYRGKRQNSVAEPEKNDKGLIWLMEGKIAMYKNQPLSNSNSKVFYGRQQFLSDRWREAAVKLIENKEKNARELDLLLKLHHPHIVQIIDAGERRGDMFDYLYIVMELCAQNLRNYVDENPFSFQKSFSFSKQIADGLAFLHENQVVHRDLKPDNVLISFDKKTVKVSDFGLSKEIQENQSVASVTEIGAGTEGFKSPESYQHNTRVSFSLDIFPYGLVVHFTFTNGKHPYGTTPNEQSYNIMKNRNRDLSLIPQFDEANFSKRDQLLDLLYRTLQHSPRDRPTAENIRKHAFFTHDILDDENGDMAEKIKFTASLGSSYSESNDINQEALTQKVNSVQDQKSGKIVLESTEKAKRIKQLEDELSGEKDFRRISQLLSELRQLRGSDDFDILLRVAECDIQLKTGNKDDSMRRVRDFISSGSYSAQEVREIAEKFYESDSYVRALILYRIANDLYETESISPDDAVEWIKDVVVDVSCAAEPLLDAGGRSREIGIVYGLKYMKRLLNGLRTVKNVSPDVRALSEAYCIGVIASAYDNALEYPRSIRFCQDGIKVLEKQFGSHVSKHKSYGWLLNNVGTAYLGYGDQLVNIQEDANVISEYFLKAEQFYLKAIKAKENALDYETKSEQIKDIQETKQNLQIVRRSLANQK